MPLLPPEPAAVADLVTPQSGSIVSRKVLAGDGGRVVLFAFAEGEGLSEHTTPFEAMIVMVEGSARVTVGEAGHDVEAGMLMPLPAGVPHSVHARTPVRMVLVMVKA